MKSKRGNALFRKIAKTRIIGRGETARFDLTASGYAAAMFSITSVEGRLLEASLNDASSEITRLLEQHRTAARFRQEETLGLLREEVDAILSRENAECAVFVRGSLAKGDFCSRSDVDLVVLTHDEATARNRGRHPLVSLASIVGRRISADFWDDRTASSRSGSISFWLAVVEGRMLAGDANLFGRSRAQLIETLSQFSVATLFEMRRLDIGRHWGILRHSPLGMNVKRGEGGLLDCDFVRLLKDFASLPSHQRSECLGLFESSQQLRDQLFLVKSLLHDITGEPRESALLDEDGHRLSPALEQNRVCALMDSQQRLLDELKTKLRC